MPGYLTDPINSAVLDCLFGGAGFVPPRTLYVGLSLIRPNKAGKVVEPVAPDYARVAVPNDLDHWPRAVQGSKANGRQIVFASPRADWGSILAIFVADSPRGGLVISLAEPTLPRTILAGDPAPTVAIGAMYLSHT